MSAVAPPSAPVRMTTEQMLALPDDGVHRELIRGELRETPMTMKNQWHSAVEAQIAYLLMCWLEDHPRPGSRVVSGDAGFRLMRNPDTSVGIDIAYISAEVVTQTPPDSAFFEGAPVLAVEILSPSDTQEGIDEKVAIYQEAGVSLIWIVKPRLKTVLVLESGKKPVLFNEDQELSAEPYLPGFRVPVAKIFLI
jgi:Uma2 family endonuclease